MRFGVLGTGHWADTVHATGLAGHPDAELVGVWGRDPAKASAVADRHGGRGYGDLDGLLADVDAISVALPPDIGAGLAVRAAAAGRHLLLEKPVALTVEAADALVDAVHRAGVASLVFVTRRYHPPAEAFLAEAATGDWTGGRVSHRSAIFQPGSPYRESAWRAERGGLWDVGPHALGIILPVLGPVEAVTAVAGPHDTYHLILRHRDGALSTLELTVNAPPAAAGWSAGFSGPAGILQVPDDVTLDRLTAYRSMVSRLLTNVAAGAPGDPLDVRAGRETVAILAAAERSASDGVTIHL